MIQLNDFRRQWTDVAASTLAAVERVGTSGWYILGREVESFESSLADLWHLQNAIGVASGVDAIEIGLRVLGCKPGDKVLTTPFTAFATTLAIVRIGAMPVFVDCDGYGLIDLNLCRSALASDSSIRYFVPVHLYGHCLDLDTLSELRDRFQLSIVEDCAQSICASWNGKPAGTVGQIAATSFYPTKNLGALGDGGAILTDNSELAKHARQMRDYGQSEKYRHDEIGLNSRLDELQAAILRSAHLPRLAAWTARRQAIARMYVEGIGNPALRVPGSPSGSVSCWHLFPVFVDADRKHSFMQHLRSCRIASAEHYPFLAQDQKALLNVPYRVVGDCENARRLAGTEVSLPIHPYLTDDETRAVIKACESWRPS